MKSIIRSISKVGMVPLFLLLFMLSTSSCDKNDKWEYKVIQMTGLTYSDDFGTKTFIDPTGRLNSLGNEGWELVTSYTEEETVHPNFGNKEYVTGLQPNTRTKTVNLVLKRKLTDEEK